MGGRDIENPWGNEIPPWVVVGREEPKELSAQEMSAFARGENELREMEKQFEVNGVFVETEGSADEESFYRRMTGF